MPDDGVIRIGKKGMVTIEYGDNPPIRIDAIMAVQAWRDVDRNFQDDKGEVLPENETERLSSLRKFVLDLFAGEGISLQELAMADAIHVIDSLNKEVERLSTFFTSGPNGKPSSRESTELTFSE